MWKMFDDMMDCNECGNHLEPPPQFLIPPPPRPPALFDLVRSGNCNGAESADKFWDKDVCDVIAIQDISMQNYQSLQASVIIGVFSLLLILVVLIGSLFVWKNKQKFDFLSVDKTPSQGSHLNGMLHIHGSSCEDTNAHISNHRPFIVQPLNINVIVNGENNHYSSGYPMVQSPTYRLPSSPGPDPYRSHDNVYEELEYARDTDAQSEPSINSDADFAEDESSLSQDAENVQQPTNNQGNCMQLYYLPRDTLRNPSATRNNQQYKSDCGNNTLQFDNTTNFHLRNLAATPPAVSSISENHAYSANVHCLERYHTVSAPRTQMNWSNGLHSKYIKSDHRMLMPPSCSVKSYADMVLKGKTPHEHSTTPSFESHLAYTSLQTTNNENYQYISPIYASSIGSDSGYSHHTATSSIDRNDYAFPLPMPPGTPPFPRVNKPSLSKSLGFNWRRKVGASSCQYTLKCPKNTGVLPVSLTTTTCSPLGKDADNLNSESICQTIENSEERASTGSSLSKVKQRNYNYPFSMP